MIMTLPVQDEFSIVHLAARYGHYKVVDYFISEHKFDVDYYKPPLQRLTLLHVIAKFHLTEFTPEEAASVKSLIQKSNNLLLRNSFGKTIVALARSMGNKNVEFLKREIEANIEEKMRGMAFIIDLVLREKQGCMNKYIIRDIYKYIDG